MLTINSRPDYPLLLPKETFQALASCWIQMALGVYLIRACDLSPSFCPIPDIGLDRLAPPSPPASGSGLGRMVPQPDPLILSGLPLTHDDFHTHRVPLPPPHVVSFIDRPHLVSAGNLCSPYANNVHENDTAQSRPDYRIVPRSGFVTSARSQAGRSATYGTLTSINIEAVAATLSGSLLIYGHHGWE